MSCEDCCKQGVAQIGRKHGCSQAQLDTVQSIYDASPELQPGEDLATLRRQAKLFATRLKQMGLKLPNHLNLDDPEGIVAIRYGRVYAELRRLGWLKGAGKPGAPSKVAPKPTWGKDGELLASSAESDSDDEALWGTSSGSGVSTSWGKGGWSSGSGWSTSSPPPPKAPIDEAQLAEDCATLAEDLCFAFSARVGGTAEEAAAVLAAYQHPAPLGEKEYSGDLRADARKAVELARTFKVDVPKDLDVPTQDDQALRLGRMYQAMQGADWAPGGPAREVTLQAGTLVGRTVRISQEMQRSLNRGVKTITKLLENGDTRATMALLREHPAIASGAPGSNQVVPQAAQEGRSDIIGFVAAHTATSEKLEHGRQSVIFQKTDAGEIPPLHGVPFVSAAPDCYLASDAPIEEPELPEIKTYTYTTTDPKTGEKVEKTSGPKRAAGAVILEPDGRLWLVEPTNHYLGTYHTAPKGGIEPGLTMQQSARKEVYEEAGLTIEPTGFLADLKGTDSMTRYYLARRTGGHPADAHWESDNAKLVPLDVAKLLLNKARDKELLTELVRAAVVAQGDDPDDGTPLVAVEVQRPAPAGGWSGSGGSALPPSLSTSSGAPNPTSGSAGPVQNSLWGAGSTGGAKSAGGGSVGGWTESDWSWGGTAKTKGGTPSSSGGTAASPPPPPVKRTETVQAERHGELVIHRALDGIGWAVTHRATGFVLSSGFTRRNHARQAALSVQQDAGTTWTYQRYRDLDGAPERKAAVKAATEKLERWVTESQRRAVQALATTMHQSPQED